MNLNKILSNAIKKLGLDSEKVVADELIAELLSEDNETFLLDILKKHLDDEGLSDTIIELILNNILINVNVIQKSQPKQIKKQRDVKIAIKKIIKEKKSVAKEKPIIEEKPIIKEKPIVRERLIVRERPIKEVKKKVGRGRKRKKNATIYNNKTPERAEISKVYIRVPEWFANPNQYYSLIIRKFMKLSEGNKIVYLSDLRKECGLVNDFLEHFKLMLNISDKNYAKVFEVEDDEVRLWEPVAEFIKNEYNKSKINRLIKEVKK